MYYEIDIKRTICATVFIISGLLEIGIGKVLKTEHPQYFMALGLFAIVVGLVFLMFAIIPKKDGV